MELVIACVVISYVLKNGVIDGAYAIRGRQSPRQQIMSQVVSKTLNRGSESTKNKPHQPPRPFRRYMTQLWDDSWDEARARHDRRLTQRQERRAQRANRPAGALNRYVHAVKDDAWSGWDRRWDRATTKRHARRADRRAVEYATDQIATAEAQLARRRGTSVEPQTDTASASDDDVDARSSRAEDAPAHEEPVKPRAAEELETSSSPDSADRSTEPASGQATASRLATVHPFTPQEEAMATPTTTGANGEATTLTQALGVIAMWQSTTQSAVSSLEITIAGLKSGDVGESVTAQFAKAQEAFGQAATAFAAAHDALQPSVQIGDMYNSNPEAGDKKFVTA